MRLLAIGIVLFLFLGLAAAGAFWGAHYYYKAPGPLTAPTTVIVERGLRGRAIATRLEEAGVIRHPQLFFTLAAVTGQAWDIKAGEYAFPANISPRAILSQMVRGQTVVHDFTVPEGWTTAQVLTALSAIPQLKGEIAEPFHDGDLLPETYRFSYGDTRLSLLKRMQDAMQRIMIAAVNAPISPYGSLTPSQILTLASIVEKETRKPDERAHVASVYLNRLKRGMKLQADPTVIYAITQGKADLSRPLLLTDLTFDSPYNTYRYTGLPPGPICNPGKAAIDAVAHVTATDDIYFVADGTGGHRFAKTEKEHQQNVAHLRAWQRKQQITRPASG